MLSTYSFKRRAILVVTMIFANLVVAMIAQSASAQEITTIAQARVHLTGGRSFIVDTAGAGAGDYTFRITVLNDNGAFEGTYYRFGSAGKTNAFGQITMVVRNGIAATRISFVAERQMSAGIVIGGTEFEGSIRFGNTSKPKPRGYDFMAGTFTRIYADGRGSGGWGPFPFMAITNE